MSLVIGPHCLVNLANNTGGGGGGECLTLPADSTAGCHPSGGGDDGQ